MNIYYPDVAFFRQKGLPVIVDPYVCPFVQSAGQQWLQHFYYKNFTSKIKPYNDFSGKFLTDKVDGTLVGDFPPEAFYVKYKAMNIDVVASMSEWFIWGNKPTHLDLKLLWQTLQWNNLANYCVSGPLYRQLCAADCNQCRKRAATVDIHDLVKLSGYVYGIFGAVLEHVYYTGKKVDSYHFFILFFIRIYNDKCKHKIHRNPPGPP